MDQVIRFVINKDNTGLTWEEYETLELAQEGEVKMRQMRPLVARFMVDENHKPLPHAQAMAILGKLPLNEVADIFTQFADAMKFSAVPKASGTPSELPSVVNSAEASLTGSQP